MARNIVTIPEPLMRMTVCNWRIDWRGQSSGTANDGSNQIVYNAFPRWIGNPVLALSGDLIEAWQVILEAAEGRAGVFRVPMVTDDRMPRPIAGIPFSSGVGFATGQGFAFRPFVICPDGAAAGATTITVLETDYPVRVGQIMSHDDWPFRARARTQTGTPGLVNLIVGMPLRRVIPAGAEIDMRAWGLFQATSDIMGNAEYGPRRQSRPELSLQEWITRP